jgi:hypothetical protein
VIKLESSDPPGDVLFAATALFPKIKRGGVPASASILLARRVASSIPPCPPRARVRPMAGTLIPSMVSVIAFLLSADLESYEDVSA